MPSSDATAVQCVLYHRACHVLGTADGRYIQRSHLRVRLRLILAHAYATRRHSAAKLTTDCFRLGLVYPDRHTLTCVYKYLRLIPGLVVFAAIVRLESPTFSY